MILLILYLLLLLQSAASTQLVTPADPTPVIGHPAAIAGGWP